jgi:hypothetical protein
VSSFGHGKLVFTVESSRSPNVKHIDAPDSSGAGSVISALKYLSVCRVMTSFQATTLTITGIFSPGITPPVSPTHDLVDGRRNSFSV